MPPNNANGRSLRGRKQTQSSPQSDMSCAFAQAQPEHFDVEGPRPTKGGETATRPFARHSIARLMQLLNDSAQGSAHRREIQQELKRRFEDAISRIEEFSSEQNDVASEKRQPGCVTSKLPHNQKINQNEHI
jgi:hypothetical protein